MITKRHYCTFYVPTFGDALSISNRIKEVGGKVSNELTFLPNVRQRDTKYNNPFMVDGWYPATDVAYAHVHQVSMEKARENLREHRQSHRKLIRDWAVGKKL